MNDEIRMSKRTTDHPGAICHSGFGFLSSFGFRHSDFEFPLSFTRGAPLRSRRRLPHPDPGPVVQFAQAAGGDNLARFEPGEDLLATPLHTADLDLARASLVLLDDENPGQSRESAHGSERR